MGNLWTLGRRHTDIVLVYVVANMHGTDIAIVVYFSLVPRLSP